MLFETLPSELVQKILSHVSQEDKVSLTYVSKSYYNHAIRSLYRNIYLNNTLYVPSDLDNTLGTHYWSTLYCLYNDNTRSDELSHFDNKNPTNAFRGRDLTTEKFRCLVRSLGERPGKLGPLIENVHCTWHLDQNLLKEFIYLLSRHAHNLRTFENFIRKDLNEDIIRLSSQLQSLTITAPTHTPSDPPSMEYVESVDKYCMNYNLENIRSLNTHMDLRNFFHYLKRPLRIKSLSLSMRKDMLLGSEYGRDCIPYEKILDVNELREIEVLSWMDPKDVNFNMYSRWNLRGFFQFKNIESLSLLSLTENSHFLEDCVRALPSLKRLKVDYMFELTVDRHFVDVLSRAACSKTLEYLDIRVDQFDSPLLSINRETTPMFELHMACKCESCKDVYENVIIKKYFPTTSALKKPALKHLSTKHFFFQMFKGYPIIPYSQYVDEYPGLGFRYYSLEDHAKVMNKIRLEDDSSKVLPPLTAEDIKKLYHTYLHSMKKTYDYFLQRFPNLRYLTLNDVPTAVIQVDEHQRCNMPVFNCLDYQSNQVYELADAESLFS